VGSAQGLRYVEVRGADRSAIATAGKQAADVRWSSGGNLAPNATIRFGRGGSIAWPGNARELGNVLERAAILAEGNVLSADLILTGPMVSTSQASAGPGMEKLEDMEKEAIRRTLALTGGNRKQTAARLGIGLRTLYDKLKVYDL
jgi:two-component system, NtrC family, response regulator AtoC